MQPSSIGKSVISGQTTWFQVPATGELCLFPMNILDGNGVQVSEGVIRLPVPYKASWYTRRNKGKYFNSGSRSSALPKKSVSLKLSPGLLVTGITNDRSATISEFACGGSAYTRVRTFNPFFINPLENSKPTVR